jgi:Spermine/spermidine synthase domain
LRKGRPPHAIRKKLMMDSDNRVNGTGFATDRGTVLAVFFISFAAIAWQLILMRCLLIARYHHFSFLVISCALLGFGAGGAFLTVARPWLENNGTSVFRWGLPCLAVSLPLCFRAGELLPLEVYFPPILIASTLGWWFIFWILHVIPFFLAGTLIGLALMSGRDQVHRVYASNLAGSAAGAPAAILLMNYFPANTLSLPISVCLILSGLLLVPKERGRKQWSYRAVLAIVGFAFATCLLVDPTGILPLNVDQYKTLAYVQRLEQQGSAHRITQVHGPRGMLDLYSSPHFHTLTALGALESPPRMDLLLQDGYGAGSIPVIGDISQANLLKNTLSALPYKLVKPKRILILGDSGGVYVWLARLSKAESIVVVHPDRNTIRLLRKHGHGVLQDPRIKTVVAEPRAFLDRTEMKFDIVHLAQLEEFAPGSGGIGGLREDYLATVEGFARCLDSLTDKGMASVIRGVQEPARDNLRIAATWIEAMESRGIGDPGNRLLMARDELSLATLAVKSVLSQDMVRAFGRACRSMSWDPEWFPGIRTDETNRIHVLPSPRGMRVSWFHHSLEQLLGRGRESLYRNWIADVRPARDNRPFFHDFFKWSSLERLKAIFGPLWPARAEMGFLVLLIAAGWASLVAAIVLPAPLFLMKRGKVPYRMSVILFMVALFGVLGAGFMFLEMGYIQIFTRFLGDPVLAAALIVGGFLIFAGAGSLSQPYLTRGRGAGVLAVSVAIAALVLLHSLLFSHLFQAAGLLQEPWKVVVSLSLIGPLAFLMGVPFPWGLSLLHQRAERAVPAAWAVNGFASVVSASGAVLTAMTYGFQAVLTIAAALYLCAGLLSLCLHRASAVEAGTSAYE